MTIVSRRNLIKGFSAAAVTAGLLPACGDIRRKPNIIIFLTDDQRWDSIGIAGNHVIKTPNVDALARKGTLFERAYVTTSICPVSRTSILTGQYARRHGIVDFSRPINDELFSTTYPSLLRADGYYTGFIGKYGVGPSYSENKFSFIRAFNGQGQYENRAADGQTRHLTQINGDQAIEFLEWREPDKSFCLSISFKAPHAEDGDPRLFIPEPDFNDLYSDVDVPYPPGFDAAGFDNFPDFFRENNEGRRRWMARFSTPELFQTMTKSYYRLITGVDRQVGRILDAVEKQSVLDNTVVIFTSDNGLFLGEHGLADKWFMHEPSIRVPLIIVDFRAPVGNGPRKVKNLALNIDIAPTILSLAGQSTPSSMQGRDLSGWLHGRDPANWRNDFLYEHLFEHPGIPKCEGVVGERFKYSRYFQGDRSFEQLFDVQQDPLEQNDLSGEASHRKLLEQMRSRKAILVQEAT